MKKAFIVLSIAAVISACGGGAKPGSSDSSATTAAAPAAAGRLVDATTPGGKLIAASDCLTCHKVDSKVIGPSYADVAAKYPATDASIDTLANKVVKGGSGNWGSTPMTGHPAISVDDAKTMVKYILTLKK